MWAAKQGLSQHLQEYPSPVLLPVYCRTTLFTMNTFERLHLFFVLSLFPYRTKSSVKSWCGTELFPPLLKTCAVRWLCTSRGLQQQGGRASALFPSAREPHNRHSFDLLFLDGCYLLEAAIVVDFPSVLLGNKHAVKYLNSFGRSNTSWSSSVQICKIFTGLKKLLMLAEKMNLYSNWGVLTLQQGQVL